MVIQGNTHVRTKWRHRFCGAAVCLSVAEQYAEAENRKWIKKLIFSSFQLANLNIIRYNAICIGLLFHE